MEQRNKSIPQKHDPVMEAVISNEQEWRRTIYTDLKETKGRVTEVEKNIASMRVWQNVFRSVFVASVMAVIGYVKHIIKGGA